MKPPTPYNKPTSISSNKRFYNNNITMSYGNDTNHADNIIVEGHHQIKKTPRPPNAFILYRRAKTTNNHWSPKNMETFLMQKF